MVSLATPGFENLSEKELKALVRHDPLEFFSLMSRKEFHRFAFKHAELKMERDKSGMVTVHAMLGLNDGYIEGEALFALQLWSRSNRLAGKATSPSAAFDLPDGSTCKSDGAWISMEKHNRLSKKEREQIAAIVPDFIMEVCSQTDNFAKLKKKMTEVWMANGVQLGWLIDPIRQKAWVYRKDGSTEDIPDFSGSLSGEHVLPGFELKLSDLLEE